MAFKVGSFSILRELLFQTRSSTNILNVDQGLWENRSFRDWAPWILSKIGPWSWLKARAPNTFHCTPCELCKFGHELHFFFRVFSPSSKLHNFYADSLSDSMQLCKLSPELHEKRPKKSVLILIRKIRCFLKVVDFGSFFQFTVRSSTKVNCWCSKTTCFIVFFMFSNESFQEMVPLKG